MAISEKVLLCAGSGVEEQRSRLCPHLDEAGVPQGGSGWSPCCLAQADWASSAWDPLFLAENYIRHEEDLAEPVNSGLNQGDLSCFVHAVPSF